VPAGTTGEDEQGTTGSAPVRKRARGFILTLFFAVGLGSIALDLLTKTLAVEGLQDREPVKLLGGFIYLDLIRNGGAAWGMGSEYTWVLSIVAITVSVGIAVYVWRVKSAPWAVAFGLIFGGALGNIVDRVFRAPGVFHGHVVDFISPFEPGGQAYPVFNLADSSLVIGVCLVVLLELMGRRMDGTRYTKESKGSEPEKNEPVKESAGD
jgi:signal peptidase II